MPQSVSPPFPGLDHVVVSGGTPAQWAEMSTAEWTHRLDALAAGVKSSGAHWVTLLPHHGSELSADEAVAANDDDTAVVTATLAAATQLAEYGAEFATCKV